MEGQDAADEHPNLSNVRFYDLEYITKGLFCQELCLYFLELYYLVVLSLKIENLLFKKWYSGQDWGSGGLTLSF